MADIGGYNYNLAANHEKDHARVPSRIMMTSESFAADAFEQWKLAHDNSYILGEFVWTSMDYLGESGVGAWGVFPGYPWIGSYCRDLDLSGLRKGQSYYRDILWNGGDRVYATVRLPDPQNKKIFPLAGAFFLRSPVGPGWDTKGRTCKSRSIPAPIRCGCGCLRILNSPSVIPE